MATFGYLFNKKVDNLPNSIKEIKIHEHNVNLLKKIPFGCKVVDENNMKIFI